MNLLIKMTTIDEILICANQLANQGKKPSVALIKSKLSSKVPLPTIISTLKNWHHEPDFTSLPLGLIEEMQTNESKSITSSPEAIKKIIHQTLNIELAEMRQELSDIKLAMKQLTDQLKQQS